MTLKYTLHKNRIKQDNEDAYVAHPETKVMCYEDLEKEITGPGSILKSTESRAVIDAYWSGIANYIGQGENYKDQYVNVKLNMSGSYVGPDDRFDPERHTVATSISPGKLLKRAAAKVNPQYVKAEVSLPVIDTVYDWGSDIRDRRLTPGGVLEIRGQELKLYQEVEGQGVLFVNQNNGEETPAERFRINEPATLTLQVPQLAAGDYRIEVRNTARRGKKLRTGIYPTLLTVAEGQ